MKFQFTVDDVIGSKLQEQAHHLGLSVSSYIRFIVKKTLENTKMNAVDRALLEPSEHITFDEFRKELGLDK